MLTEAMVARAAGAEVLEIGLRNAGAARACGLDLVTTTSRVPPKALWLATTDADSRVPPDWFVGLSGAAYRRIGGFPRLALAEDHALVAALTGCGLRIARPGDLPVVTSARRDPRAAGGFGELLRSMELPSGEAASA